MSFEVCHDLQIPSAVGSWGEERLYVIIIFSSYHYFGLSFDNLVEFVGDLVKFKVMTNY
jgi:hypothetical protein